MKKNISISIKAITTVMIALMAIAFISPIVVTVSNSFMTSTEIRNHYQNAEDINKIYLIPRKITITQYFTLLLEKYKYINMFWNSVLISVSITALHLIIAVITAYVFAKTEFKGRDTLFFVYIVVMMMPFQVTLLPNYIQARFLGILNTYWAIILPGIFTPFGVFLMRQFMKSIPDELIEVVYIESGSLKDVFIIAIIPSIKSGIIALGALTFAENWNMVEQPLVMLNDELKYPLSLALNSIIESSLDIAFAGSVIYMIPMFILYSYFEDSIIDGLQKWRL